MRRAWSTTALRLAVRRHLTSVRCRSAGVICLQGETRLVRQQPSSIGAARATGEAVCPHEARDIRSIVRQLANYFSECCCIVRCTMSVLCVRLLLLGKRRSRKASGSSLFASSSVFIVSISACVSFSISSLDTTGRIWQTNTIVPDAAMEPVLAAEVH